MTILDLLREDGHELKRVGSTNGGEWAGACPSCGGTDRFRVWPLENGAGRWWCRQCKKTGDAIQYLRDFRGMDFKAARSYLGKPVPTPKPKTLKPARPTSAPEAVYPYLDEHGKLLAEKCRFPRKRFAWRRTKGKGYEWDLGGIKPGLFRLPELIEARKAGRTLFICEGEKDCNNVAALGLDAITNPMGAGEWRPDYSEHLRGTEVVILPDNDEAGRDHTEQVARSLLGKAKSIKVLALPDLPEKGDVSDWLEAGGTREQLEALAEAAPTWTPPAAPVEITAKLDLPLPAEEINSYHRTDSGNAELFAALYCNRVRYDHGRGRWLLWRGQWWSENQDGELHRLALDVARVRYLAAADEPDPDKKRELNKASLLLESKTKTEAMLALTRNLKPMADTGEGWDQDPWLLAVNNGVVDLRTGELRPGKPGDKITRHLDLEYDPGAPKPQRWLRFLEEIFSGDKELIAFIHRAVGYSLTGDVHEKCLFLCHGVLGDNGKTVFLNTLTYLLGPYATDAANHTFTVSKYEGAGVESGIAKLDGARLVTALELRETDIFNEARIKRMTGGDPVTCKWMGKDHFTYKPQYKIWLTFNQRPRAMDDRAFFNRVQEIPFLKTFDKNKEPDLADTLRSEAPGILAWAVKGCLAWQEHGHLDPPLAVENAVAEFKRESDFYSRWLEEKTDDDEGAEVKGSDAYRSYTAWCEQQGLKEWQILAQNTFGKKIGERFKSRSSREGVYYKGFKLRKPVKGSLKSDRQEGRERASRGTVGVKKALK